MRDLARPRSDRQVRFALANYTSTAIQKSVTILGWQERERELVPRGEANIIGASESDSKINATVNRTYIRTLNPSTPLSNRAARITCGKARSAENIAIKF